MPLPLVAAAAAPSIWATLAPYAVPAALTAGSALAGGLASKAGKRGRWQQIPTGDPGQIAGRQQVLQQALSGLQNPTAGFAPIAQQAQQDFQSKYVPSLAERFTALGGQRSSGFQSALQQGASGLASNLASQQAQYGLQNQGLLQKLLGIGLQPNFENVYQEPQQGFLGGALGGLSSGLGSLGIQGLGQSLGYLGNTTMGNQDMGGGGGGALIQQLLQALQQIRMQGGY